MVIGIHIEKHSRECWSGILPTIEQTILVFWATEQKRHSTHPDIYNEFLDGNFVVRRASGTFNMLPTDQV